MLMKSVIDHKWFIMPRYYGTILYWGPWWYHMGMASMVGINLVVSGSILPRG